jgi:hypothetical protein
MPPFEVGHLRTSTMADVVFIEPVVVVFIQRVGQQPFEIGARAMSDLALSDAVVSRPGDPCMRGAVMSNSPDVAGAPYLRGVSPMCSVDVHSFLSLVRQ